MKSENTETNILNQNACNYSQKQHFKRQTIILPCIQLLKNILLIDETK